ncbi:MAG: GTPase [Crenarchaeota archaeon]|nr:GTPase [Thermoproteota archaeon]
MYVVVAGMAGSGKTSLVAAYAEWLRGVEGEEVSIVNLDPGVEVLPYKPDFDIRSMFTVSGIMRKYGLGPNGALLKASELIALNIEKILGHPAFDPGRTVLIDTPGQLEVFLFRREGRRFVAELKRRGGVATVFLVDGSLAGDVTDFVTSWVLGLLLQLKLDTPTVPVISKADLVPDMEVVEKIVYDPLSLRDMVVGRVSGVNADLAADLLRLIADYQQSLRPVLVSARERRGFEELYSVIHEVFCSCGDLS